MEQFLYRIQPVRHDMLTKGSTESESHIVSEHFNYLKRLTEDGVIILAGRTQTTDYSSFGIVLLKAETIEEAREIMLNDPAVKNKVFRAELYPYKTSLFNPDNAK
jgi:uncharacterized protein YciI